MKVAAAAAPGTRERFMRHALLMAERGLAAGGPPVGACLVRGDEILAAAHNSVIGELDITAHAEITVIRAACREQRSLDLGGSVLFVTVEPCLMCLAACFYAGIAEVHYGAGIGAIRAITGDELSAAAIGPNESRLPALHGGLLEADCKALIDRWAGLRAGRAGG